MTSAFAEPVDLEPATAEVSRVVQSVRDDQLTLATPCSAYQVGALLDHLMGLCLVFAVAARKGAPQEWASESAPAESSAEHLDPAWRVSLPDRLASLAAAWQNPQAWQGETNAGGIVLPAGMAGLFALDEVVLHGRDLAQAVGLPFTVPAPQADAVAGLVESLAHPHKADMRAGLFGPKLAVPDSSSRWHRTLGLAGRDPDWTAAAN